MELNVGRAIMLALVEQIQRDVLSWTDCDRYREYGLDLTQRSALIHATFGSVWWPWGQHGGLDGWHGIDLG